MNTYIFIYLYLYLHLYVANYARNASTKESISSSSVLYFVPISTIVEKYKPVLVKLPGIEI